MNISKDHVVSFEYTLRDEAGVVLDTSEGFEPMEYIHGNNELILGLERELEGKEAGAVLQDIVIKPCDAYGERDESLVAEVERDAFPDDIELKEGMQFEASGEGGAAIVTVIKAEGGKVTIDGNHPLAGKTLRFDVKVLSVREATEKEKAHGLEHSCGCGCDDCGDSCCGTHNHE